MIRLNPEQKSAVEAAGNAVVTACPGSGKTRVLAARVIRALGELGSRRERVIALTFTNRAADEIEVRLDQENIGLDCLWAGTIHSFALEWVMRPYAPYCEELRRGFSVADEFYTERLIQRVKREAGIDPYAEIRTTITRNGLSLNTDEAAEAVFQAYKAELRASKLIDYDDVLFLAYRMLADVPEIASTLGAIIRAICVDEVQDIQDLQYGILSKIYRASLLKPTVYFVGDGDQSIYESLGATTKTPAQIASEFGLEGIEHFVLHGNYRSTQRIIDLYRQFRPDVAMIEGRARYAGEQGLVTLDNQTITKEQLSTAIALRVSAALRDGVRPDDICVIAPQWWHVKSLARQLVSELPGVDFDAPGLSPLHGSREDFWFKIARLVLTRPTPTRTRTRGRWAREAIVDLRVLASIELPDNIATPRRMLRVLNGLASEETVGLSYLRDIFSKFLKTIALDIDKCLSLKQSYDGFFEKAENRLANTEEHLPSSVESFRRLFSHPAGVVVNTCHGVKGEEYDTVVAFGLLRGYIPNWDAIINSPPELARDRESKLLYVVCSRAKRRLHLIAETGRLTKKGRPYETSELLRGLRLQFDER